MSGIDVVVPCYGYGRFLRDSVDSILSQRVGGLRVLIFDNGSRDNTFEVAQEIIIADPRVEVVRCATNRGQQAGYNYAIEWASSEFFMILDADDILAPGCLARAIDVLSANPGVAFAHGKEVETYCPLASMPKPDCERQPSDWRVSGGREFIDGICKAGNNIVGTTTVVRRTSMQKIIGYYPPELEHANDLNMWLRLATLGGVAETSAIQGIRRRHPDQVSAFYRDKLIYDFHELLSCFDHFFRHEGGVIEGAQVARRTVVRKIASNALVASLKRFLKGRAAESGELFEFALSTWRKFEGHLPAHVEAMHVE